MASLEQQLCTLRLVGVCPVTFADSRQTSPWSICCCSGSLTGAFLPLSECSPSAQLGLLERCVLLLFALIAVYSRGRSADPGPQIALEPGVRGSEPVWCFYDLADCYWHKRIRLHEGIDDNMPWAVFTFDMDICAGDSADAIYVLTTWGRCIAIFADGVARILRGQS